MQCRFMQCAAVLFFSVSCRVGHGKVGHGRALLCRAWQSAARRGCFEGLGRMFAERAISR